MRQEDALSLEKRAADARFEACVRRVRAQWKGRAGQREGGAGESAGGGGRGGAAAAAAEAVPRFPGHAFLRAQEEAERQRDRAVVCLQGEAYRVLPVGPVREGRGRAMLEAEEESFSVLYSYGSGGEGEEDLSSDSSDDDGLPRRRQAVPQYAVLDALPHDYHVAHADHRQQQQAEEEEEEEEDAADKIELLVRQRPPQRMPRRDPLEHTLAGARLRFLGPTAMDPALLLYRAAMGRGDRGVPARRAQPTSPSAISAASISGVSSHSTLPTPLPPLPQPTRSMMSSHELRGSTGHRQIDLQARMDVGLVELPQPQTLLVFHGAGNMLDSWPTSRDGSCERDCVSAWGEAGNSDCSDDSDDVAGTCRPPLRFSRVTKRGTG